MPATMTIVSSASATSIMSAMALGGMVSSACSMRKWVASAGISVATLFEFCWKLTVSGLRIVMIGTSALA
jgi:hypothetical protein